MAFLSSAFAAALVRMFVILLAQFNSHFQGLVVTTVRLRLGRSDFGCDPMISPTLCQVSFTARKSKFSLRPMACAVGDGRKRTSSGSSRKVLSATGKGQPRRGGMAFADRC